MLSSLDNARARKNGNMREIAELLISKNIKLKWNLLSYYYIRKNKTLRVAELVRDHSEEVMVDSGAHSFQFGKKENWGKYTEEYAQFIKNYDRDNVVGYFEMDIENIIGYKEVLKLRRILENASDKIIPVWHKNRGIEEYEKMCSNYSGKVVAIGGFKNTDIRDEQYLSFLKTAKKYSCKVHCLGMTRDSVLEKVPFDYCDSASWQLAAHYWKIGCGRTKRGKITRETSKNNRAAVLIEAYKTGMEMQEYYHNKWIKVCKD